MLTITITGDRSSGKSTLARLIAKLLTAQGHAAFVTDEYDQTRMTITQRDHFAAENLRPMRIDICTVNETNLQAVGGSR